ncbi:S-adenosyl-L-methionine-dependent methyltransferase [Aspergillus egyptiacus]|nr:S-adenosyl-L-methionine-dependent methyltransferase [Aspergillus egyptiacus]
MEVDAETLFNYLGKRYEDAYADSPHLHEVVRLALSHLRPHSRVLDVGCGTGKPVADMLSRAGHQVHGIDIAENMVQIAQSQIPSGTFTKADMRVYEPPTLGEGRGGGMDAVFAVFSLFQISPSDTYHMAFRFAEWLADDGVLVVGFSPTSVLEPGQGEYDEVWGCVRGVSKPWMTRQTRETFLSEERWREVLREAGFSVLDERAFRFTPRDSEHTVVEEHRCIIAKRSGLRPLLGPHPLPRGRAVREIVDQKSWKALQGRLVVEDGQGQISRIGHTLALGAGLSAFFKGASSPAAEVLVDLPQTLPFEDSKFDGVLSMLTLDFVPSLEQALSELIRVTNSSSPNATITIVQGAPNDEVTKLLNTLCLPLAAAGSEPIHQGYLLQCASEVLAQKGFADISLQRVRAHYVFDVPDAIEQAADEISGFLYREDNSHGKMKEAMRPHLQHLFEEHPGVLRNDLVMLVARPARNGVCANGR